MSTWAAWQADAELKIGEVFGEPATYTPESGAATALADAVWEEEEPQPRNGVDGESVVRTAHVAVRTAALASPARGATLTRTATGEGWTVDAVHPQGAANVLTVVRAESAEKSAENARLGI